MKAKSKARSAAVDVKIMISQEARDKYVSFIISIDDAVKILKEYHSKIRDKC